LKKSAAKAEKLEARVKELEAEIKLWHDMIDDGDNFVSDVCHVMRLMEKIIKKSNDE
jgi:cell division protein FtsB